MNLIKPIRALLVAATLTFASIGIASCGDDESATTGNAGGAKTTAGNGIDRAFVADMIPHHESAVEMAKIAESRGQSTFVKDLADDIIRTQNEEIMTMQDIATRLDAAGVKQESLGVPEHEMGMDADTSKLKTADPFDRAFIDMMVPHHQGAIRMARVELAKGSSAETKKLATAVIAAQTREINEMNAHRTEEFGGPSPAGGVPPEDDSQEHSSDEGSSSMDHE